MPKRIAIIGAGPIGLEAALYARNLGHEVVVYERRQAAANVALWEFVRFFSPWSMNVTSLGREAVGEISPADSDLPLDGCPTGREFRERYLLPISRCSTLRNVIRENNPVLRVIRQILPDASETFAITAQDSAGHDYTEQFDVLLDCSGTYTNPRGPGEADLPAAGELALKDRIFYTIPDIFGRDRHRFADHHTLLMGCGFPSANVLRALQDLMIQHPRTAVTWAIRRPDQPIYPILNDPLRTRQRLLESTLRLTEHPPGWLRYLTTAVLASISHNGRSFSATFRSNGALVSIVADEVVSLIGFRPDNSIYAPADTNGRDPAALGNKTALELLKTTKPNFFFMGAKKYGTNSNFLLQAGHMQISEAFGRIEDRLDVDLY